MYHEPVLLSEVIEGLGVATGKNFVDCNLGGGGHAKRILEKSAPDGKLIGIDLDIDAIMAAQSELRSFGKRVYIVQDNFSEIEHIVELAGVEPIDGVLFDLGLSKYQLEESGRGFSFKDDAPLDMSFSHSESRKASDVLNEFSLKDLSRMFRTYGELSNAELLARKVDDFRQKNPFNLVSELVNVALLARIARVQKNEQKYLSQVFQSLRIEVNNELEHLRKALDGAVSVLSTGGYLVVISYHSLEDRIVKHFIRDSSRDCVCPSESPLCTCDTVARLLPITKRPIVPTEDEITKNNKSRSAKLRIAQKI